MVVNSSEGILKSKSLDFLATQCVLPGRTTWRWCLATSPLQRQSSPSHQAGCRAAAGAGIEPPALLSSPAVPILGQLGHWSPQLRGGEIWRGWRSVYSAQLSPQCWLDDIQYYYCHYLHYIILLIRYQTGSLIRLNRKAHADIYSLNLYWRRKIKNPKIILKQPLNS